MLGKFSEEQRKLVDPAIDRAAPIFQCDAGDPLERRLDLALHRMRRIGIARGIRADRACGAEKSGMLAGAIVVERGRLASGTRERLCGGRMARRMHAAGERARVETGAREHAFDHGDVRRFAGVGSRCERQLVLAESEPVRGAGFDERQRLQGLDRRTGKHRARHLAQQQHRFPVGVDHGHAAAMLTLDPGTADDFDQHGIGHKLLPIGK